MKLNKNKIIAVIAIIFLICLFFFIRSMGSYYSVSDRVSKVKNNSNKNSDYNVVGWVKVQGTNIDYPVIYTVNPNFDFDNVQMDFTWKIVNSKSLNIRTVILGHNVRNVSSKPLINEKTFNNFENLPSFLYYDFVKENKYIQYSDSNNNYLFKIYAVYMIKSEDVVNKEYMTKKQVLNYAKEAKKNSYYDFDVDIDSNDKLITLTTCTRFFGMNYVSIVVDGRLVREGEKVKNYKVKENKNYDSIKKILEGDEDNDKA